MRTSTLFISLIILCVLFSSCGSKSSNQNQQTQTPQTNNNSSTQNNTTSQSTSGNNNNTMTDKLIMLEFDKKNIPSSAKYKGNVVAGSRWIDKDGENLLLITETNIQQSNNGEDMRSKELFAYCYLIENGNAALLWNINDFVKDCPVDITLEFIPGSLTVTDLNNNGIAENTFLYKLSCKGDVSPDDLKLMMHEGDIKYAIRGTTLVEYGEGAEKQVIGGEETPDVSFKSAPEGFLKYAQEQWNKFRTQQP